MYREEGDAAAAESNQVAQADFDAAIGDYKSALLWDPKYSSPYAGLEKIYADPLYQGKNTTLAAQDETKGVYLSIAVMTNKADMFERFSNYAVSSARKTFWLGKACTQLVSAQAASSQSDTADLPGMVLMQAALTARVADVNAQLAGQLSCPPVPPKPH